MAEEGGSKTKVQLRRIFAAPREEVFRAWTTAEALEKWFAPSDDYKVDVVELDLRVGGQYRIEMRSPQGQTHILIGVYREIQPPAKLVYTWTWEQRREEFGDTLVTVEFRDLGERTEIVLTHEFLPTPEDLAEHEGGWTGCLMRLPGALEHIR